MPFVILIHDLTFVAESWRELVRRRAGLYLGLAATEGIAIGLAAAHPNPTAGFGSPLLGPLAYAASQPGVILHYLRLALWPWPLVIDYGWPVAHGVGVLAPGVIVLALIAATVWAVARRAPLGAVGAWFFLTLAPSSSVVPIKDLAFEHRMYLALAAVITLVVV